MLRSIFTPLLKSAFDDPRSPSQPSNIVPEVDDTIAEDFAYDVRVEILRRAIDELKYATDISNQCENLAQIHAVLQQDERMKVVFSELDGYILLVSVLSTLRDGDSTSKEWDDTMCAAFRVVIVSLVSHAHNRSIFESAVGFDALRQAIQPPNHSDSVLRLFGLLLSLAFLDETHFNFFLPPIVPVSDSIAQDELDAYVAGRLPQTIDLKEPKALIALFKLCCALPPQSSITYILFRTIDRIAAATHRNQATLNEAGLMTPIFNLLYTRQVDDRTFPEPVRHLLRKTLRRLLDVGFCDALEARDFLRRMLDGTRVDSDILAILKSGSKSKWPEFFSFHHSASLVFSDDSGKLFPPPSGFTFDAWIYVETLPSSPHGSLTIFGARSASPSRWIARLNLLSDGSLSVLTSSSHDALNSAPASIRPGRWTHIAIVHYAQKTATPTLRLYIDSRQVVSQNSVYPKPSPPPTSYHFGADPFDEEADDEETHCRWSMASCHLIATSLPPELVLLAHRLGPRYQGNFQDASMFRFLTYQTYTSINVHLFHWQKSAASQGTKDGGSAVLTRGLSGDVGFSESQVILSLDPRGFMKDPEQSETSGVYVVRNTGQWDAGADTYATLAGDIVASRARPLDVSLWRAGGPSVALELVHFSTTSEVLLNSLTMFCDTIRTSWQNSEDAERLQAYDILVSLLRPKAQIFSMECFKVIFSFIGIDFSAPEDATIVNSAAYRSIALDLHFWSLVSPAIQTLYWQHFAILLQKSKFQRFNIKQRFAKKFSSPGVIRLMLFILQTDLYSDEMIHQLVGAIEVIAQSNWSSDSAIKPILSYLAANLPAPVDHTKSPFSVRSVAMSRIDRVYSHEKAALVLKAFVSILETDTNLAKFNAALPSARIAILLLGPSPTPTVAAQILRMIGLHLASFANFSRKLDLASFWSVLKAALPPAWDGEVHEAAFDLLLGRYKPSTPIAPGDNVRCSSILPTIMASLEYGLDRMVDRGSYVGPDLLAQSDDVSLKGSQMEAILERLIDLQASSSSFRTAFRTKSLTPFISFARSFLPRAASLGEEGSQGVISRLSDKVSHLAMMLALDTATPAEQIRELRELAQHGSEGRGPTSPSQSKTSIEPQAQKTLQRVATWRATILAAEKQRRRKAYQDLREKLRALRQLTHWESLVHHERGLWPSSAPAKWRLDETEGPYRVRKKLETEVEHMLNPQVEVDTLPKDLTDAEDWVSVSQVTAPWDEAFDFSITDDQKGWDDDLEEDRLRKIRHELEPGDVIEVVKNVARIVGVDSAPGLFIWGQTHLYVRDGLVESSTGDILEAIDAPTDVLSVPGTLAIDPDPNVRARRWSLDALASFSTRTYLFRDVAVEIYFKDSRSVLCVFASRKDRQAILAKLQKVLDAPSGASRASASLLRTPLVNFIPSSAKTLFTQPGVDTAQRRWQAREISNFAYLQILNQASGRTPNDLTQYPVFPWVLQDYTSQTLDLQNPSTFRDLTMPMGALNPSRREAAEARYDALTEIGEKPFHYGTHYSSSMITSHFLIRLEPYSRHFKSLQGGDFDLPERLFVDVRKAWESASSDSRGDVRELIPEFFTCPEFLQNLAGLELGTIRSPIEGGEGEKVGDVKLPPWARGDPLLFVSLHRKALESAYVSRNLPAWIDLIWGNRQRDVGSCNIFHPLSYEGAIDLDSITDPLELAASVGIIHNFGQTPRKIFSSPHPPRYMEGELSLPLGSSYGIPEHAHLLIQGSRPVKTIPNGAIGSIYADTVNERIIPAGMRTLHVPSNTHERIEWGFKDGSLRLFVDRKLVQIVEAAGVTCAASSDPTTLLTGSSDNLVQLFRLIRPSSSSSAFTTTRVKLQHLMRGHADTVLCIAASRAWSLVVSGSEDGSAIIWDLNRATYVRSVWHERGVTGVGVHETSGTIVTCSINVFSVHTINGQHIASTRLGASEPILSMSLHERETSLIPVVACGSTYGSITLRTWGENTFDGNGDDKGKGNGKEKEKEDRPRWKVSTLRQLKLRRESVDEGWVPGVTAVEFVGETLYSGDSAGRVFAWELPD